MRINTDAFSRNQNLTSLKGFNIGKFNQKAQTYDTESVFNPKKDRKEDRLTLTPFKVKSSNLLESLMEQKQNIMDQKNKFINNTLENGIDLKNVKSQIELYDEQLKNIDKQMNDIMLEQSKPKEEHEEKESIMKKEKTEEEINAERLNDVTSKADSLTKSKVISKVKNKLEREAVILKSEQAIDASRGYSSPSKDARINKIEDMTRNMESDSLKETNKINNEIKKENEELKETIVISTQKEN